MMRTSNPAMRPSLFSNAPSYGLADTMTIQGTVNKCFVLFFLLLISASWVWNKFLTAPVHGEWGSQSAVAAAGSAVGPYIMGGAIVGLILAFVTIFNLPWSKFTAPAYALCEGLVLGGISAMYERAYPGIVVQAVALTFGTLFCMLFIYKSGVIQVNRKFIVGLTAATGAVFLVYLGSWILGMFGIGVPFIYSSGIGGIGFSLIVVAIAAFNLILDFYVIEQGAQHNAPKYMEWYGAFALMVTLVWLYLEILRLLAKSRRR